MDIFEIYDKRSNETIEVETHPCFADYGVYITLNGRIILTEYGRVMMGLDDKIYGIRPKKQITDR